VRLVVNTTTGVPAQQIDYDAWGTPTYVTGPADFQPFGFAGGLHDPDTGLVRFGARDYDPETGTWTVKDPIRFDSLGINLYGYTPCLIPRTSLTRTEGLRWP
jgi:RHS repeat-associated protein